MALLFSNTLDEAVAWLTESTGEAWTVRRVLDEILAHDELILEVVPPRDTQFGIYRYDPKCPPEMGYLPAGGGFVFVGPAEPRLRFPLRATYITELLEYGEAELVYAEVPAPDDPNGRWVRVRPMFGPPLRVTLDMCRVPAADARMLAAYCVTDRTPVSRTATPPEGPPVEAEPSAPVADPLASVEGNSDQRETTGERNKRIVDRCDELKNAKVRGWQKQVAKEFGRHESTIKKVLKGRNEERSKAAATAPNAVWRIPVKRHKTK